MHEKKKNINEIVFNTGTHALIILTLLPNLFPTERFITKCWKRSKRQLQNKTLQIIKTAKSQNYINTDDDQKYSRKRLGRRYGANPFSSRSRNYN